MNESRDPSPRDAEFTELYETHYRSVRAYASSCVSAGDVDDVVAETFLVAWRRADDVPTDWTRGWLIGVTRNVVRARLRASRRAMNFVGRLAQDRPTPPVGPDEQHIAAAQMNSLRTALAMLRPADQELLMLTGQYDLSLEEVAVALEISANAAGVRIHRARERLRAAFARTMEAGGEAA